MAYAARRRWSDNDKNFGPFTFALSDCYRTFAVCLTSSDDEDRAATFRLSIGRCSFLSVVPSWLIRPERRKVHATYWSAQDIERLGRDWYWQITPREYGLSLSDGFLNVSYGRVTHDSSSEQRWGYFLPWTQWRQVAHRIYDANGKLYGEVSRCAWDDRSRVIDNVSKARFVIEDYDGEQIKAGTYIEEREWRRGAGWFRWLGYVLPKKHHRALDIRFEKEVGTEKGSWKGGLIGTSIEMAPGETHEQAFKRYCAEEHRAKGRRYRIKFVS